MWTEAGKNEVKENCLKLAQKYLSEWAQAYALLLCKEDSTDVDG